MKFSMPSIVHFIKKEKAWQKKYDAEAPKVGDLAPDFELVDVSGENRIRLSDFKGRKPVALIFGSFTWPPYVRGTVSLRDLYEQYKDQVQFLTIYIREAHPKDGWWLGGGIMGKVMIRGIPNVATEIFDPKTMEERRAVAGNCEESLQYGIPTYVDEMDDRVSKAYAAKPTRLYLIGLDGRVVYAGGLGPYGFSPSSLENAIQGYLTSTEAESQLESIIGD